VHLKTEGFFLSGSRSESRTASTWKQVVVIGVNALAYIVVLSGLRANGGLFGSGEDVLAKGPPVAIAP
jgi:hypothetical protein